MTLGQIAAGAGVSKANLTVLFGNKESLQLAVMEAAAKRFTERVIQPALRKKSPLARITTICDRWYEHVQRRDFPGGCMMYATAHEYRARPGPLRDRAANQLDLWKRLLGSQLKEAKAAGEVPPDLDVRSAVVTLVSYQNVAHLASLLEDEDTFARAWQLSRQFLMAPGTKRRS